MVLAYFATFLLVAVYAFYTNRPCLFFDYDGVGWAVVMEYFERFSRPFSITLVDPLQGMFDIYMQGYRGGVPQIMIMKALGLPGVHKTLTHIVYAMLLTVAVYLAGRSGGFGRTSALLGAFLLAALALPMFEDTGILDPIGNLNPNYTYVIAVSTVVVALAWRIDGRSWRMTTLLAVAIGILLLATAWSFVFFFSYLCMIVCILWLAALWADKEPSTVRAKLWTAGFAIAVLVATGIPTYLYDLGSNTAMAVFAEELVGKPPYGGMMSFSNIIEELLPYYLTQKFAWLMTAGLVIALVTVLIVSDRKLKAFAYGYIGLVAFYLIAVMIAYGYWHQLTGQAFYKGPTLYRMVHFISPFGSLFVAAFVLLSARLTFSGVIAVADRIGQLRAEQRGQPHGPGVRSPTIGIQLDWPGGRRRWQISVGSRDILEALRHVPNHLLLLLVLGIPAALAVVNNPGAGQERCPRPYFSPLDRNPLIDFLIPRVALELGKDYRGSVATFTGLRNAQMPVWAENISTDYNVWYSNGNDLRTLGLWQFNIPTLVQVSVSMTPQYFLTVAELLATPADRQMRTFIGITRPNDRMMALWGVRYVISDQLLGIGEARVEMPVKRSDPPHYGSPIRLVELADSNLGNYSPTEVMSAWDAKATLDRMREPGFDGRRTVVTNDDLKGRFVQARDASMTVEKGGLRLKAVSTAESLLVLPVQFSHCWVPGRRDRGKMTFFRANMMQLGVRFSGELDALIEHRFGPLWNSGCRRLDAGDAERMKMSEARTVSGPR